MIGFEAAYHRVIEKGALTFDESREAFQAILTGEVSQIKMAAFLMALKLRGETPEEIVGAATALRDSCVRLPIRTPPDQLLDTCGTGGDRSGTFNVSTAVAFVAAAAGVKVAKHGNRSVSSKSGSADVLETLGVPISKTPEQIARDIDEIGIGFIFAPAHHPAMKHAAPVRKELATRTIFNILGPLSNPAGAKRHLLGIYSPTMTETIARVLSRLGTTRAFVVSSLDGLDEISPAGKTRISELNQGHIETIEATPADFGYDPAPLDEIKVENAMESAEMIRETLAGRGTSGSRLIVILNAGFALVAAGAAERPRDAFKLVEEILDKGKALGVIEMLKRG